MNDERLFERLASHDGPATLDSAFDDRLYSILEREMRRGRSLRPALLLAATLVLVLTITAAIGVGSGLIRPPWLNRVPVPDPPTPLEWSGPLRPDSLGMVVQPMVPGDPGAPGQSMALDGRDAASGWVDITRFSTDDPSRRWTLDLVARPPGLLALAAADQILAYGVVLESTGDDVPDWVVGIDNDAPEEEFRLWVTDLATGHTDEQVGGPYGGLPFFDFSHPSEEGASPLGPPAMRFFFLGNAGRWGTSLRFYGWASLTQAGEVVAWDYAPDTTWVAVPGPDQ
jgi:hypothetical protein